MFGLRNVYHAEIRSIFIPLIALGNTLLVQNTTFMPVKLPFFFTVVAKEMEMNYVSAAGNKVPKDTI